MPKTAVGLFSNSDSAEAVVREIEALGFPHKEVRKLEEPSIFEVTGVMSFQRLDFEVELMRELTRIGGTKALAQAYVEGLRKGGALVLATGSNDTVERAADVVNRHGAVGVEETSGPEPELTHVAREEKTPMHDTTQAGRIRQSTGGAGFFVW